MNKWNIKFIIEKIRSSERVNSRRDIIKNETTINLEIEDIDLEIMLKCNNAFKGTFSYDKLFEEDKKNILKPEVEENMIKEYYVNSYNLNFTDKVGCINLCYPKVNLL